MIVIEYIFKAIIYVIYGFIALIALLLFGVAALFDVYLRWINNDTWKRLEKRQKITLTSM